MVASQSFLVSKCNLENGKLPLEVDRRGLCFYQSKDLLLGNGTELWLLMHFFSDRYPKLTRDPAPITGRAREYKSRASSILPLRRVRSGGG